MPVGTQPAPSRARWAGEAYDFLRLFHDASRRVVGLALFQLGWAVFVYWMRQALAVAPATPAGAAVPLVAGLPLSAIYLAGAFGWLVLWLSLSGLWWALRRMVFARLIRPFVWWYGRALALSVTAVAIFADVIVVVLRWPFARMFRRPVYTVTDDAVQLMRDTFARTSAGLEDDLVDRLGRLVGRGFPTRRALYAELQTVLTREQFERVKPEAAIPTFFGWMPITAWTLARFQTLFSRVLSSTRVAFSPLIATTWEEKLEAAAAPSRIYAWPVGELRAKVMGSRMLAHLGFVFLPPLFAIENADDADRRRRRLGLDAIVWGSARTDGGEIWLHVEQDFQWLPDTRARAAGDDRHVSRRIEPFPHTLEIRFSSVAVAADDDMALLVLLLLVLLRTLEIRRERGWHEKVWGRYTDVSAFDRPLRTRVLDLLVDEIFLRRDPMPVHGHGTVEPIDMVLARTVSQWVGSEIVDRRDLTRAWVAHLEQLAARCAEVLPDDAETLYRLAALHLLLGREAEALAVLTRACALEPPLAEPLDVYVLAAMADLLFDNLTGLDWKLRKPSEPFEVPSYWPSMLEPVAFETLSVFSLEERRWSEFVITAARVIAQRLPNATLRLARMAHAAAPYASLFEFGARHGGGPALVLLTRIVDTLHPDVDGLPWRPDLRAAAEPRTSNPEPRTEAGNPEPRTQNPEQEP
jgi:hypothetical protein